MNDHPIVNQSPFETLNTFFVTLCLLLSAGVVVSNDVPTPAVSSSSFSSLMTQGVCNDITSCNNCTATDISWDSSLDNRNSSVCAWCVVNTEYSFCFNKTLLEDCNNINGTTIWDNDQCFNSSSSASLSSSSSSNLPNNQTRLAFNISLGAVLVSSVIVIPIIALIIVLCQTIKTKRGHQRARRLQQQQEDDNISAESQPLMDSTRDEYVPPNIDHEDSSDNNH
eukprot:gb/GECH01004821.1/.p1 GENE.gb/GECH01004821.1/~~gb/GECH01004821.1/.p1  ORF type:complete len:224 (+),score=34.45 gb/GECH01004821.1/:1-672(+)